MKKAIVFLVFFTAFVSHLSAQLVTDRPDQTESSSTVGKGNLQIESGILLGFEGENHSIRQLLLPTTLFRYGISEGVEIRLLSQFEELKRAGIKAQGISDLEIGVKFQLLQPEERNTEMALLTHLLLPTGSAELTGDRVGFSTKLAVSHSLSENMGLGYNLGYSYPGFGSGDLTFSLVLGTAINEKAGFYVETYGELAELNTLNLNFDTGFTYLLRENLQIDFSLGTGINHRMNYLATGVCWLIGKN